ncbi:substrate-binding domain-containing protein [Chloroflexota bacterium]
MGKSITIVSILLIITFFTASIVGCTPPSSTPETVPTEVDYRSPLSATPRLRVATTTSLYDTGLWGYLEPLFEDKYDIEVDVMYAGTGKAIEYGQRGDVDVITVHSKSRELAFVEEGYGVERVPFAYNYFLIVGPESDPAGIAGMEPGAAFKELIDSGNGNFISRGDDSGTHGKEKAIWTNAGYDYADVQKAGEWYIEAGAGMGPCLNMADEKQSYTLTDLGTYLAFKGNLELVPIVDEGVILLNVYSVIACNPENTGVNKLEMSQNMVNFLASHEVQKIIGNYGVNEYGMRLFTPCAGDEP